MVEISIVSKSHKKDPPHSGWIFFDGRMLFTEVGFFVDRKNGKCYINTIKCLPERAGKGDLKV